MQLLTSSLALSLLLAFFLQAECLSERMFLSMVMSVNWSTCEQSASSCIRFSPHRNTCNADRTNEFLNEVHVYYITMNNIMMKSCCRNSRRLYFLLWCSFVIRGIEKWKNEYEEDEVKSYCSFSILSLLKIWAIRLIEMTHNTEQQ